ncbi:MAG: tetratricopeptide repeat protein [Phycisphaerae bacterium]|nr:tetratricopeptide repeat protein [Phycisphaerae bacterium]
MLFEDSGFSSYDSAGEKAQRAYELYEDGDYRQSLLYIEEAIKSDPTNSSLHFNKGLTFDSLGQFERAIEGYEAASELAGYDLEILNCIGVNYMRIGQHDKAIEYFENMSAMDPMYEPSYCNRIIAYCEIGKHDLAEQMFYMAQQIDENCPMCFYNIGNCFFAKGEYEKAKYCWQRVLELDEEHPQINYRIGQSCWCGGELDKAKEYMFAEIRQNPADIEVIRDIGLVLFEKGEINSACEKFHRILEFDDGCGLAHYYLGEIYLCKQKLDKAKQHFEKALELDREIVGCRYRLAQLEFESGDERAALRLLRGELDLSHEDADMFVSMGSMFMIFGDFDCATHCMVRAVGIDGDNAKCYYYLGLISAIRDRNDDACDFFDQSLELDPDNVSVLRDYAIVLLKMKKPLRAARLLSAAVELAPDDRQLKAISVTAKVASGKQYLGRIAKKMTVK